MTDESPVDDHRELDEVRFRRELYERFPVPAVAFSRDGRVVTVTGPITLGVRVGGFAVVENDQEGDDGHIVVQARELELVERDGPVITFDRSSPDGLGLPGAALTTKLRTVVGEALVLGILRDGEFVATSQVGPFGEQLVRPATTVEVGLVRDALDANAPTIEVGVLRDAPDVAARLVSTGFSRHTFMCGQSGSGKTYTTGVLFERLLMGTTLPMVVIDPNSDHVHLGSLRDPDDPGEDVDRYRQVAAGVATVRARGQEATHTLCIDFSDLDMAVRAQLLRLHPIGDLDEYHALASICTVLEEPFSVADVAAIAAAGEHTTGLARRIDNLRLDRWDLWRRPGERSVVDNDARSIRCLVIDTGSLGAPDERSAVALAVLANRWRRRRERIPTLIAVDEAHNVFPASTRDSVLASATDVGAVIAGEGRKFGLHLFIASQRPGKVHPNVLSQCDNLVLMRMNGADDVADLERTFSHVRPMLLRESLTFGLGQALFAGKIAPVPLLTQVGTRLSPEGGGDIPTTWATPPS